MFLYTLEELNFGAKTNFLVIFTKLLFLATLYKEHPLPYTPTNDNLVYTTNKVLNVAAQDTIFFKNPLLIPLTAAQFNTKNAILFVL